MLLQPKKSKYKKLQKSKLKQFTYRSTNLKFGDIGLKAIKSGTITARQIESARQSIVRKLNRKGKLWIKIFPWIPITKKPQKLEWVKEKDLYPIEVLKLVLGQFYSKFVEFP